MVLERLAVSQYRNFNFNSMCKFGDTYIGANEFGIFTLDGEKDYENHASEEADIEAYFVLPTTDFFIDNNKRFRSVVIGYESSDDLSLLITDDDNHSRTFTLKAVQKNQLQEGNKVAIGRDGQGRYWSMKISNTGGCDFSVDAVSVLPVILMRKWKERPHRKQW
jgi:hypothetical protein